MDRILFGFVRYNLDFFGNLGFIYDLWNLWNLWDKWDLFGSCWNYLGLLNLAKICDSF